MERSRESWYERQELGRVTKDWIDVNCKLTNRELELLQIMYDRKLVRRDYLEVISPSYRVLGKNKGVILNRAIKKLYKLNILDKVHEPREIGKGNSPAVVSIDKCGSMILGVSHKKRIIHRKSKHKGKEYIKRELPINYKHINAVNKLEVETILICEDFQCNLTAWQLEKPYTFMYKNEKVILIPDILCIIKVNNKAIPMYIEYDTGSEGKREKEPTVIKDKIIKYKKLKLSKVWLHQNWQSELDNPTFPIVLFVTEDESRINFFKIKSSEHNVKSLSIYCDRYSEVIKGLIKSITK